MQVNGLKQWRMTRGVNLRESRDSIPIRGRPIRFRINSPIGWIEKELCFEALSAYCVSNHSLVSSVHWKGAALINEFIWKRHTVRLPQLLLTLHLQPWSLAAAPSAPSKLTGWFSCWPTSTRSWRDCGHGLCPSGYLYLRAFRLYRMYILLA